MATIIGLMVATFVASPALATSPGSIQERLERAQTLNITAPITESRPLVEELLAEIGQATPRQQAAIRLLAIRTLGLQGNSQEALDMAGQLLQSELDTDQRLSALRLTANIAMIVGEFEAAFSYLGDAIMLLDEVDSDDENVSVYGLASYFHSMGGDSSLAVEYALLALDSARRSDSDRLTCLALGWLAHAYEARAMLDEAWAAGNDAMPWCRRSGDAISEGWVEILLAGVALLNDDIEEADALIDLAASRHSDSYHDGNLDARLIKARVLLAKGEAGGALAMAEPLINQSDRSDRLAQAFSVSADAAASLGDYHAALEFSRRHIEAREDYLKRTRSMRLAFLEIQFNKRHQEQGINLLKEQSRVTRLTEQSRRDQDRLKKIAMIFGGIILILLILWLLYAWRDRRHFRRLSRLDGLTDLYNHTRFFELMDERIKDAKATDQPLVLALGDIDHFKEVNDRFGHQIGDEVLRQTARLLKEIFETSNLIGRVGGEEFAICLINHDLSAAREVVEQLRQRLAGQARRKTDPPITISFGIGQARESESPEELRRRTDQALYQAKNQGRNRVILADS